MAKSRNQYNNLELGHQLASDTINKNLKNVNIADSKCNNHKYSILKQIKQIRKNANRIIGMKVKTLKHKFTNLIKYESKKSLMKKYEELSVQHQALQAKNAVLKKTNIKLAKLAIIDKLTGIYNRNYFEIRFNEEINRAKRENSQISVLIIDGDKFKLINDTYGHKVGDIALKHIANSMKQEIRQSDIAFRIGGDEFFVILPNTDIEGAKILASRIQTSINKKNIKSNEAQLKVSVSIGVECISPNIIQNKSISEISEIIFNSVDKNLYKAKVQK